MKLSKETLAIFKNFATINSNLTLKSGSKLTTISTGKNIIAEADTVEQFDVDFGIYDLNEFLGVLSLFEQPNIDFTSAWAFVCEDSAMPATRTGVRYFAASPSVLTIVPTIKQFPQVDIKFGLSSNMLSQIQRVSSILKVSDFSFVGDGTTITVEVGDKNNPTSNTYAAELGPTDRSFRANFKVENLKMLAGDYVVSIGGRRISRFQATFHNLTYYVAIELDSVFGD